MFAAGSKNIIQGLTNTVVNNHNDGGAQIVNAMKQLEDHSSLGALHNSNERYDQPKCHPKTRTGVLQDIIDWINGIPYMLWLYGSAGLGKSAIAQSTAETLELEKRLAAAFFFSRTAGGSHRDHEERFIFTIALQLMETIPELKPFIVDAIIRTPSIWGRSLTNQVKVLILDPLMLLKKDDDTAYAHVIIVDGLDECRKECQVQVLEALRMLTNEAYFKVFVASRPEYIIETWFSELNLDDEDARAKTLNLDSVWGDEDVRVVFQEGISRIKRSRILRSQIPADWPLESVVDGVIRKASGHFIYVSTLLKYIESPRHRDPPHIRLQRALASDLSIATHERPFADLDNLYLFVLRNAEERRAIHEFLALDIVRSDAEETHGYIHLAESLVCKLSPVASLGVTFLDVASLIQYPRRSEDDFLPYKPYHASLHDFLRDPIRSEEFFVDLPHWQVHFCLKALELLHENVSRQQNGEDIEYLSEMAMQLSIKHLADPNVTSNLDILHNVSDASIDFFASQSRNFLYDSIFKFRRDLEVHVPHSYIDETPLFRINDNHSGSCHFMHPTAYRLIQRRIMPLLHAKLQDNRSQTLPTELIPLIAVIGYNSFYISKFNNVNDNGTLNRFGNDSGWYSLLYCCYHYHVPGTPIFSPKDITAALLFSMKNFLALIETHPHDGAPCMSLLYIYEPLVRSTLSSEIAGLLPDAIALFEAYLETIASTLGDRARSICMLNTLAAYVEIYNKLSYLYEGSGETDNRQALPGNLTQRDLQEMRFGELAERAGLGGSYEPVILAEGGFMGFNARMKKAEHESKCRFCGVHGSVEKTV